MRDPRMRFAWRPAAVAAAALTFAVCGGSSHEGPSLPSVPAVPAAPVAPLTPTPEPPLAASCLGVPPGSLTYHCSEPGASFQGEVDEAIRLLKAERPEVFDGERVLNVGAYVVGLIRNLDRQGVCATYDGEELVARHGANFSDHYDVLTASNLVRRYYVGTCTPAVFPLPENPLAPSPAGCSLPPSRLVACGEPPSQFVDDVNGAVEQLMRERPGLFDPASTASGREWPAVRDFPAYYQGIVDILAKRGYCAAFDGEEVAVKKANEFSEQFDVNYQDRYVRVGPGIYRGACYPAAF